jgi:hypothetical protein
MNNASLGALLRERLPTLRGRPGLWQATIDDVSFYVVTDETHDRMRIIAPITKVEPNDTRTLWTLLAANYDSALDAKYAIHDGVIWATFLHRLSWLSAGELDNAIDQVVNLARTTGTTFSSSDLKYGGVSDF